MAEGRVLVRGVREPPERLEHEYPRARLVDVSDVHEFIEASPSASGRSALFYATPGRFAESRGVGDLVDQNSAGFELPAIFSAWPTLRLMMLASRP